MNEINQLGSREIIEANQLLKLRSLFGKLSFSNPFYASKIHQAGLSTEIPSLDTFFSRMPFTDKLQLIEDQRRHPPYGSNLTYDIGCYTRFSRTSATTGKPMCWLDTPKSWEWMLENWAQVYKIAGVNSQDRILFAFSFGPFLGFWTAFESGTRLGCLCIPGGGMSSLARLTTLIDNGVTVLCCTPTYAVRLAEVASDNQIDLSKGRVRVIIVAGEPGGSVGSTVAAVEQFWPGAKVIDHHGMTESGPVSYGCPKRRHVLHVMESSYISEVLNVVGDCKVAEGEVGELILTSLGRVGSPLIRYKTGDLVRLSKRSDCECGSSEVSLEGGILGRTDDMVVVRGVNIYPSAVEEIVRSFKDITEYRVEVQSQGSLDELKIQVECSAKCIDKESVAHRLQMVLRSTFSLRIPVSITARGTLPRFEFKAKRWIRR